MKKNLIGLGLRTEHFNHLLTKPATGIGWFEAITENFINTAGAPLYVLEQIRSRFPVSLHGVALSIGSADGVRHQHLKAIRDLVKRIEPFQVSDHFCFARSADRQYHELLPLPRTAAMAKRVIENIDRVQTYLQRPLVLENISAYLEYAHNEMTEAEFINLVAEKSGCKVLLDVNNVFVNATNFRYNARRAILAFDPKHVVQYHLAGFTELGTHLFDTHAARVHAPVRQLFRETLEHIGERPFSIERDDAIPSYPVLERETLSIAALGKTRMPAQFLTTTAQYPTKGDLRVTGSLARERSWQRYIYTAKTERGETAAGSLTPAGARKVYRNAYGIRLTGSLRDKYKHLALFMREAQYSQLLQAYVQQVSSTAEDLGTYGDKLPGFVRRRLPKQPWLSDVALFDQVRYDLFHRQAPATPPGLLERRVRLGAAELWQSRYTLFSQERRHTFTAMPRPERKMQYAIIYRDAYAVRQALLTPAQFDFVQALRRPQRLTQLLKAAERQKALSPGEIRQLFSILGISGVLA